MQYFERRAKGGEVLASLVDAQLRAHPGEWDRFTARQDYPDSPHKDTRCIPLRWLAWPGLTPQRVFSDLEVVAWPALQLSTELQILLRDVGQHLPGPIARAVLVELAPGGVVSPHVDEGLYSQVTLRHHFCVSAPEEAWLWVGQDNSGEVLHIPPGELWTIDKDVIHGAENKGSQPRVHLIVDTWKTQGGLSNG